MLGKPVGFVWTTAHIGSSGLAGREYMAHAVINLDDRLIKGAAVATYAKEALLTTDAYRRRHGQRQDLLRSNGSI